MNIHIDKDQFNVLKERTIVSIEFGSYIYGLSTEDSDKDFLHIIDKSEDELYSFVWSHHNYQYSENGIDHVFTTIQHFISNLLKGDSTVNFECLFSKDIKNSKIQWLTLFQKDFVNYALMRSYLGLARRDLNAFLKKKDFKKLYHGIRGVVFYEMLKNDDFDLTMKNKSELIVLKNIRSNQMNEIDSLDLCRNYLAQVENCRKELNDKLNSNEINRIMDASTLKQIDTKLINFYTNNKKNEIFLDIYSSLNYDVKYDK